MSMKIYQTVTSCKFWFRFFSIKKKQCWTIDYFYPYKVYFQSWKSPFQQQEELLQILLGNAGCALYQNYIRNENQSIHTTFNSLKEHLIHRVISLGCCESICSQLFYLIICSIKMRNIFLNDQFLNESI